MQTLNQTQSIAHAVKQALIDVNYKIVLFNQKNIGAYVAYYGKEHLFDVETLGFYNHVWTQIKNNQLPQDDVDFVLKKGIYAIDTLPFFKYIDSAKSFNEVIQAIEHAENHMNSYSLSYSDWQYLDHKGLLDDDDNERIAMGLKLLDDDSKKSIYQITNKNQDNNVKDFDELNYVVEF